jgi:uncharacterized protein
MKINTLVEDINLFVKGLLKNTPKSQVSNGKVIHDPILGTNLYQPHEIALIDLPFCQRLRKISQTDVASLIFPSANHNRLEHSLGVATIAGRIINSLRSKLDEQSSNRLIPLETEIAIRSAAILHDTGQGLFSHLSDYIMKEFEEVVDYRKQNPNVFAEHKPHEMLSYLITKDPDFKTYFRDIILRQYDSSKSVADKVDLDSIANMIVAKGKNNLLNVWQCDIINGPFDADKLDYLQRDAYFSGLKIGIDLDRFLHSVWIDPKDTTRHLKVMTSGSITLEQVLFGKVLLYNTMYQHHKVLAAECAVRGIFEILESNPSYNICGLRMDRAIDFLNLSEGDILSLYNKPQEIKEYLERFLYRSLFKRALVISADCIKNPNISPGYAQFKELSDYPKELKILREKLVSSLNGKCKIQDIWIVLPRTPTFSDEASMARIQDPGGSLQSLRDPFKVDEWLTAYWSNKWTGYVFCPPDPKLREEVGKKAAELFFDEYKFELKPSSFEQAKIR